MCAVDSCLLDGRVVSSLILLVDDVENRTANLVCAFAAVFLSFVEWRFARMKKFPKKQHEIIIREKFSMANFA